jgi:predicted membrane protein
MRRTIRPIITLGLGFVLALLSAALTYSTPPAMQGNFGGAAAFFMQSTLTPPSQDLSEIGSTDGIVIMGFLIAVIIVIPILIQRESWRENH